MSAPAPIALTRLTLASDPRAWQRAGFRVEGDTVEVGTTALRLAGPDAGRRIVSCEIAGIAPGAELDGLPVAAAGGSRDGVSLAAADGPPAAAPAPGHPNGVTAIDHVVAFTPNLDRTVAAGQALGLDLRRVRDEPAPAGSPRQAFFRLGDVILEVAQAPPGSPLAGDSPARFYGLAFVVDDLDAMAARSDGLVGDPRDAVQPGRRIATFRREAGLGLPVALMTPRPERSAPGR